MSRSEILETIRKNRPESVGLPEVYVAGEPEPVGKEDLLSVFIENLKQVGATVTDKIPFGDGLKDFSLPEIRAEYASGCPVDKLYELETILLDGRFGVAENGAIWIEEDDLPNRLLPFVTQQLIIRLDKKQIVHNMHEAYSRIQLENTGFGVFISGPSKTADIEQSLVYGAHGAKTLTVVLAG